MEKPRHVLVMSVQEHEEGALVTLSGKAGQMESWLFGPSQMRVINFVFSSVLSQVTPAELVKEMGELMQVQPPCDVGEVPFQ